MRHICSTGLGLVQLELAKTSLAITILAHQ